MEALVSRYRPCGGGLEPWIGAPGAGVPTPPAGRVLRPLGSGPALAW